MDRAKAASLGKRIQEQPTPTQRIAARYAGTYRRGATFERDDYVTHGGNLWCAKYYGAHEAPPGPAWQLAVRKGKDGKPGKPGKAHASIP